MKSVYVKICLIMCALVMAVVAVGCSPKITAIYLDQEAASLNIGESIDLCASVFPENADASTLQWTSANTTVASVDEAGHVTAVAPGTCKIVCSSKQGITANCSIEVKDNSIKEIVLSVQSLEMKIGESIQIEPSIVPDNAEDKTLIWTSSDESIVTVDANGGVLAVSAGEATITCTAASNGVSVICKAVVAQPTAIESLNTFEKNFYDFLLDTVLPSYYNPAAFRIRTIKEPDQFNENGPHNVMIISVQSTNRLGGMTFDEITFLIDGDSVSYPDILLTVSPHKEVDGVNWIWANIESDNSSMNLLDVDTNIIDYTKINAALEEHWESESMTK